MRSALPWIALVVALLLATVAWFVRDAASGGAADLDAATSRPSHERVELASTDDVVPASARDETDARRSAEVEGALRAPTATAPFRSGIVEIRVVHDDDGTPFAGAQVTLPIPEPTGGVIGSESKYTGANGTVRFENLVAWPWPVLVEAEGHAPATAKAEVDAESPHAQVELRLAMSRQVVVRLVGADGRDLAAADLGLDPASWAIGIVLGSRCGLPGERFEQSDAPAHRARGSKSDATPFRWEVEIRSRGAACVHALLGDVILASEPLDPRATEVLLSIDAEALRRAATPVDVRVVDEDGGRPIAGARIFVRGAARQKTDIKADAEGRARIEGLVAGEIALDVIADGYVRGKVALRRPVEGEAVVRLHAARTIAGTVVDADGQPSPDTAVGLFLAGEARSNDIQNPEALTFSDASGSFRFEALRAEQYVVDPDLGPKSGAVERSLQGLASDAAEADCRRGDVVDLVVRALRPTKRQPPKAR